MKNLLTAIMYALSMVFMLTLHSCINSSSPSDIELKRAENYFAELELLLSHDSAMIWGVSLYGPTMFVNPDSRIIIANQQDKSCKLTKKDNVYFGVLPEEYNIANTAMSFYGELWACISRTNFANSVERNLLLVHESWHRIQNSIGIKAVMSENIHLEEVDAAILMKLEMLALADALRDDDIEINDNNVVNALTIRNIRQSLYPNNNENKYECHEGLAEYTAFKVLANNDENYVKMKSLVLNKIENALKTDTYTNSFAYTTGPAYGFILDKLSSDWRDRVLSGETMTDILLSKYIEIECIDDKKAVIEDIIKDYDVESFINDEYERLTALKQKENEIIDKFNESRLLYVKNDNISFTYNPNEKLIPYKNVGTIYKTMRLSGKFGVIEVDNGVLITSDWSHFIIPYDIDNNESHRFIFKEGYSIKEVDSKRYEIFPE